MLTIRHAQMARLDEQMTRRFTDAVIAHVELTFPLGPSTDTRHTVERGIAKARGYGFHLGRDVLQFIHLVCLAGLEFDAEPRIRAVLGNRRLSAAARLRRVFAWVASRARV